MQVEPYPEPQAEPQSEPAEDMESLLEEHLEQENYVAKRGAIRTGYVIQVSADGALIDIGLKREGFVPAQDLRQAERTDMGEVHVGDEIHVMIVDTQNDDGYVGLSIYRARLEEDWVKAEKLLESNEIYEGTISGYNRGGLTVQFGRIRGFIPLSHVVGMPRGMKEQDRRQRLAALVGQPVGLRVKYLPAPIDIDTKHITYRASMTSENNNTVVVKEWYSVNTRRVPVSDYPDYRQTLKRVSRWTRNHIFLETVE
jgi:DNA-directed RNA polymerase subunit E'/Rpb7